MTLNEYIANPYGKGASFAAAGDQKEKLEADFQKSKSRIVYKIYRYRNFAIYHIVVPSTNRPDISYDVVLEFPMKDLKETDVSISGVNFRAFSNCPSFIFTYAYVFKKYNMMCDWLAPKYSKEIKNNPSTRNAYNIIGYERSLYLAMRYIQDTSAMSIATINTVGIKVSGRGRIIESVRSQSQIMNLSKSKMKDGISETAKPTGGFSQKDPISSDYKKEEKMDNDKLFADNRRSSKATSIKQSRSVTRMRRSSKTKSIKSIKSIKKK